MPKGHSLHIGLNSVDPAQYEGWDGQLAACEADAKVVGTESIRVAAGTFSTTRIDIKQTWMPAGMFAGAMGGRTLTLWYAPEVKRVVKYSSRATVGAYGPIDSHFDLELTSYQLK